MSNAYSSAMSRDESSEINAKESVISSPNRKSITARSNSDVSIPKDRGLPTPVSAQLFSVPEDADKLNEQIANYQVEFSDKKVAKIVKQSNKKKDSDYEGIPSYNVPGVWYHNHYVETSNKPKSSQQNPCLHKFKRYQTNNGILSSRMSERQPATNNTNQDSKREENPMTRSHDQIPNFFKSTANHDFLLTSPQIGSTRNQDF